MESEATILIVDDEPTNVDMLSQELEEEGYKLLTAYNGEEALIKVQEHQPDLILLDVMMPMRRRVFRVPYFERKR